MELKTALVDRTEEIRALFIFGLLAVLASFRVSSASSLEVVFPYGQINLLPIIDEIIVLWSLYAFFMVLGLSKDSIGITASNAFRGASKVFLQISYILLAFILLPVGFVAYGFRFVLMLLLIVVTLAIGFLLYLYKKDFGWEMIKSYLKKDSAKSFRRLKPVSLKQMHYFIWALIFTVSTYAMLSYSETSFAGQAILFVSFVFSACSISMILYFNRKSFTKERPDDCALDY